MGAGAVGTLPVGITCIEVAFVSGGTADALNACLGVGLAITGSVFATGVALLAVGGVQRSAYNRWLTENQNPGPTATIIYHTSFVPLRGGMALGWHAEF
jgi:hypothetical protein